MNVRGHAAVTSPAALADMVRLHRTQIASLMLQRTMRRSEWTLAIEGIALGFADAFAAALAGGDPAAMFAWIGRTSERYAGLDLVSRLLATGTACVEAVLESDVARASLPVSLIRAIDEHVALTIAQARAAHARSHRHPVGTGEHAPAPNARPSRAQVERRV